jgi:glucose/arabinose dehydrogenase
MNPNQALTTEERLLFFDKNQTQTNHNGGKIAFGTDGFLYASIGDGGGGGDPQNNAQNRNNLFGKILRIDVDRDDYPMDANRNYGIPTDNPFAGGGGSPEIYAWGIRNMWKFSFDRVTGQLWGGDVGQGSREEIDIVTRGANFGWRKFEGELTYNGGDPTPTSPSATAPIFTYNSSGGASITGGYVYRGTALPAYEGHYFYADYVRGNIDALTYNGTTATNQNLFSSTGINIASFGEDEKGELYFIGRNTGRIYRFTNTATPPMGNTVTGIGTFSAMDGGVNGVMRAVATDASGNVYVGGTFSTAGSVAANNIAVWNPATGWATLGAGTSGTVNAIALRGNEVVIAGSFTLAGSNVVNNVAVWNGTSWQGLGNGTDGAVRALAVNGNDVFVGGTFVTASGTTANNIARWDGTAWNSLAGGMNNEIRSLAFKASTGELFAGGNFTLAGGTSAVCIARWNGTTWAAVSGGTDGFVNALTIATNGDVYAGGSFVNAGGNPANRIARWDGTNWLALGAGVNSTVNALAAMNTGNILVGGNFSLASADIVSNIALWNTTSTAWQAISSSAPVGTNGGINALTARGLIAYAGGGNVNASNITVNNIARLQFIDDLIVTNTQTNQGNYGNVMVKNGGVLTLGGSISAEGSFIIESGGRLVTDCQVVTGSGNFVLLAGGTLTICSPAGIVQTGAVGDIQVTGTRTFATDATYIYRNVTTLQQTGNALPNTILNLEIDNNQNVTATQDLNIKRLLTLTNGNFNITTARLTLLSTTTQTAMVIQKADGTNSVTGTNVTVQRHITGHPTGFQGIGYHYFSSPVQNGKVSEFADDMPLVLNPNYDWVAPYTGAFPNFFRYNETKVQATPPNELFEKGWESPASTTEDLTPLRGYIANIQNGTVVDFSGELNNGSLSMPLTRGSSTNFSGWHLLGNPYPAPISWANVVAQNPQLEATVWRRIPTGQYAGSWASFANGIGLNGGTDEIPVAQGFFVRASTNGITLNMNNSVRLINYTNPTFYRTEGTEEAKKEGLIKLEVSQNQWKDEIAVYFEDGATENFDFRYDAERFQYNSSPIPSLTSISKDNKQLAINGLATFEEDQKIPLTLFTYANGKYKFSLKELKFFKNTIEVFIEDKLLDKVYNIRQNTDYEFDILDNGLQKDRFVLRFTNKVTENKALSSLAVFPNPSPSDLTIRFFSEYQGEISLRVYDLTGRVRKTFLVNKNRSLYETQIDIQDLESGLYIIETIDNKGNREEKRISKL